MYQSITVIGRLGRDPEMRYLPNGDPVTSFSMATDRAYNDKSGQKVKETTWFRISVFGKQAEIANQYLSKGKMALVEGRLKPDPKTGGPATFQKQDGTMGTSFEIVAQTVRFLSPKDEGAPGGGGAAGGGDMDSGGGGDDIPF
jgi:single-strand DNA-binding protein